VSDTEQFTWWRSAIVQGMGLALVTVVFASLPHGLRKAAEKLKWILGRLSHQSTGTGKKRSRGRT
jgi:hypothetical protein